MRRLTLEGVKDYVQVGVGLSIISGGIITALTLFSGGDEASSALVAATDTPAVMAPAPTETTTPPEAVPARGEFLRVRFGTEQDPVTRLPNGDTVGPDDDIEVCAGETLYAWVEHSFRDGDVLNGRLSSRAGTLFSDSVPADERAPNFWLGVQVSDTGIHTLTVSLEGGDVSGSWSANVTCGS